MSSRGVSVRPRSILVVLLVAAVVVSVALAVRAVGVSAALRTPAPEVAVVTAEVVRGDLSDVVYGTARTQPGLRVPVEPPVLPVDHRPVVTGVAVRVGEVLTGPRLLLSVSDRPVILLPGEVPLYRSLGPGDRGPDVERLQRALATQGFPAGVDGTFGADTALAVASLYRQVGAQPVDRDGQAVSSDRRAGVPLGEVLMLPTPVTVTAVAAGLGSVPAGPVVELAAGPTRVVGTLPSADVTRIRPGAAASVSFEGGPTVDLVVAGTQAAGEGGEQEVELLLEPRDPGVVLPVGAAGELEVVLARVSDALLVPTSALAADPTPWVEVVDGDQRRRVAVEVLMTVAGRAAVRGDLAAGDRVVIRTQEGG